MGCSLAPSKTLQLKEKRALSSPFWSESVAGVQPGLTSQAGLVRCPQNIPTWNHHTDRQTAASSPTRGGRSNSQAVSPENPHTMLE